ncbi:hypothetical protein M758_4G070300 [Ceratodon purpureus]|nr:hypothetical protein M758_4G070300 [Ceratodon purpureus]
MKPLPCPKIQSKNSTDHPSRADHQRQYHHHASLNPPTRLTQNYSPARPPPNGTQPITPPEADSPAVTSIPRRTRPMDPPPLSSPCSPADASEPCLPDSPTPPPSHAINPRALGNEFQAGAPSEATQPQQRHLSAIPAY